MNDELERGLRSALAARAGQITQERLRFGVPPTLADARSPLRRWWWLPLPAGLAIVTTVLAVNGVFSSPDPTAPAPVQPAGPAATPSVTLPTAEPTTRPLTPTTARPPTRPTVSSALPQPTASRPATSQPAVPASATPAKPAANPAKPTADPAKITPTALSQPD